MNANFAMQKPALEEAAAGRLRERQFIPANSSERASRAGQGLAAGATLSLLRARAQEQVASLDGARAGRLCRAIRRAGSRRRPRPAATRRSGKTFAAPPRLDFVCVRETGRLGGAARLFRRSGAQVG